MKRTEERIAPRELVHDLTRSYTQILDLATIQDFKLEDFGVSSKLCPLH